MIRLVLTFLDVIHTERKCLSNLCFFWRNIIEIPGIQLVVIIVESFSIFPPVPLGIYHSFEKNAWTIFRISRTLVQCLLDCQAGIKANAKATISCNSVMKSKYTDKSAVRELSAKVNSHSKMENIHT